MKILFECKFHHDKQWAKDYAIVYSFRNVRAIVIDVLYYLFVLYTTLIINKWFLVGLSIYMLIRIISYFRNEKSLVKVGTTENGPREVVMSVGEEFIFSKHSTGFEYHTSYSEIVSGCQTKNYIYLLAKPNNVFSFKKDSFIVGNDKDFIEFLRAKGLKI